MKNFFDWQYADDSLDHKHDKCNDNTDHTTGNAFDRIDHDVFNSEYRLILNQNEERMIHCEDEDNYLQNSEYEAQDLDYLEDDEDLVHQQNSPESLKQEFHDFTSLKEIMKNDLPQYSEVEFVPENSKQTQTEQQKTPDYKLSKKWKQKIETVLEQKNIHQFSAKHNRNMAKFFVRIFAKYIKLNPDNDNFSSQIYQKVQEILEKNCISLKDLQCLFGGQASQKSRQFLARILRNRLKQEVIKSQDVQNKTAYLLCSKVYALRCRSRHLTGRLQSR